jgi:hypothetical protein
MSKSTALRSGYLLQMFNRTNFANITDDAASSPLASFFIAAHTADPGVGGTQVTSECAYTGYARIGIVRSGAGWVVSGNTVEPATNPVELGQCTAGSESITHFTIGELTSGAGRIFYIGEVNPNIAVSVGVTPSIDATVEEE